RAFQGETITETIAAVLKSEPDWEALGDDTPWRIQDLLRKCLTKDPHHRLPDIANVRIEIRLVSIESSEGGSPFSTQQPIATPRSHRSLFAVLAVLAFLLASVFLAIGWFRQSTDSAIGRFVIELDPDEMFTEPTASQNMTISADGKHIVYVAFNPTNNTQQLYLRPVERLEAEAIAGTEGGLGPFFSPDGQWIGFTVGDQLRKVSLDGSSVVTISQIGGLAGFSPDWGDSDLIVFGGGTGGGLWQVPASGGDPQPLTRLEDDQRSHGNPQLLPGSRALVFSVSTSEGPRISVLSLETGEQKSLTEGSTPQYVDTGHIVFQKDGLLFAAPFELDQLELTGSPFPLSERVRTYYTPESAQYAVSRNGILAYIPEKGQASTLLWVDRHGQSEEITRVPQVVQSLRLSPDGRHLALAIWDRFVARDIWIYEIEREILTRSTVDGTNHLPAWSADGQKILFASDRNGGFNIFWKPIAGTSVAEQLTVDGRYHQTGSVSSKGLLAFTERTPSPRDIWLMSLGEERTPQEFLTTPFDEGNPEFSPDSQWIAFHSNQSGRPEVYVISYPSKDRLVQISTDGGTDPRWGPDGKELFYRNGKKLMAVAIRTQPEFLAGSPQMMFEGDYAFGGPLYDVSPDGQRFLMMTREEGREQIHVVLNWFEELKRLAPTDN
ncbi:MAG: hypothetical protein V3T61_02330, partial [Acidobacteriota bacterium]